MEFHSHNEAETEAIGARLAAVLNPGAVVAYLGDLGMGKTGTCRRAWLQGPGHQPHLCHCE